MVKKLLPIVFCILLLTPLATYADNIVGSGIVGGAGTLQDSQFEDGSTLDSGNAFVLHSEDNNIITSEDGKPLLTIGVTTLQGSEYHADHVMFLLTETGLFLESEAAEPLIVWNVEIEQATIDNNDYVTQVLDNVHDTTPTDAQLNTAFGTPEILGRGFIGTIDDASGDTNFYIAITTDASWFWVIMTKAL